MACSQHPAVTKRYFFGSPQISPSDLRSASAASYKVFLRGWPVISAASLHGGLQRQLGQQQLAAPGWSVTGIGRRGSRRAAPATNSPRRRFASAASQAGQSPAPPAWRSARTAWSARGPKRDAGARRARPARIGRPLRCGAGASSSTTVARTPPPAAWTRARSRSAALLGRKPAKTKPAAGACARSMPATLSSCGHAAGAGHRHHQAARPAAPRRPPGARRGR
jgi:hypothetical protein